MTLDFDPELCYCGSLIWTIALYGRVTHKHMCPERKDPFCQAHPEGCPKLPDEPSTEGQSKTSSPS